MEAAPLLMALGCLIMGVLVLLMPYYVCRMAGDVRKLTKQAAELLDKVDVQRGGE